MNAASRRESLLGWLRGRHGGTAAQAAEKFGVSERTILRDINVLRDQGEVIGSSRGPGGGFLLSATARLSAVRMSIAEVVGLTVAVQTAQRAAPSVPFSHTAERALDRLVATLPHKRAKELRRLLARIVVSSPACADVAASLTAIEDEVIGLVEEAFASRRLLHFDYLDAKGRATSRTVEAQGLLIHAPAWYLIAQDRLRNAPRTFRMDRIANAYMLEEAFILKPAAWLGSVLDEQAY